MPAQRSSASSIKLQLSPSSVLTKIIIKIMNQQNIVVENIINRIISKSRKNSLESLDCKTVSEKSEYSHQSQPMDQEYIIKKNDLRQFVQKMALENYENNITAQRQTREKEEWKIEAQKWKVQFEQMKKNVDLREQAFKKKVEETQSKYSKEKKKREQMELELNWSTNKIKQQMREIQKLKHSTISKNVTKWQSQNGSLTQQSNKDKMEFLTPGKDSGKKLQNLGVKNCESIDYSLLNSDVVHKFVLDHYPPTIKECSTEQSKQAKLQRNGVLNSLDNHPSKKGPQNIQISRFHRHAQIDEKERILKLLAEKCLFLQSYIQKLTKKYLGQVVYNQQPEKQKNQDRLFLKQPAKLNLKMIQQNSSSSLQKSQSQVALSSAFQVQAQI